MIRFDVLLLLLLSTLGVNAWGQERCNYINFVLMIDDAVVSPSTISNEQILVRDKDNVIVDTIIFTYNIGTWTFDQINYNKFLKLIPDNIVTMDLRYVITSPLYREYKYSYDLAAKWLNHGYMIMNIYNFDNKKNWKEFDQRTGYGVEWQASERSKIISRKPRRK